MVRGSMSTRPPRDTGSTDTPFGDRFVQLPEALTVESLEATLTRDLGPTPPRCDRIVFDATGMQTYTSDARAEFIRFVRGLPKETRIGVVTDRPLWRMMLSAMSLAASREIRVYSTRAEAAEAE